MKKGRIILDMIKKWRYRCGGTVGMYNNCSDCKVKTDCEYAIKKLNSRLPRLEFRGD